MNQRISVSSPKNDGNELTSPQEEAGPSSRKRKAVPGDAAGTSSTHPRVDSDSGNPPEQGAGDQPPSRDEYFRRLLDNHEVISDLIQEIHRQLHTHVPAGFQAAELTEMLEERHGGPKMEEIRRSLSEEGRFSPYFREIQSDFQSLKKSGGTEAQLRRNWSGRGEPG